MNRTDGTTQHGAAATQGISPALDNAGVAELHTFSATRPVSARLETATIMAGGTMMPTVRMMRRIIESHLMNLL